MSHSSSRAFEQARAEQRAALVGYLPAGFPDVEGSIAGLKAMVEAGCDVIEIGLPYSDPVMDGPTIQQAAQQALDAGVRTDDVLRVVEAVAATGVPTLVMTYWNPIERYGVERFTQRLADAGGAGLITPDITPDYAPEWIAAADARDLDKVFLVSPSSTEERIAISVDEGAGPVALTIRGRSYVVGTDAPLVVELAHHGPRADGHVDDSPMLGGTRPDGSTITAAVPEPSLGPTTEELQIPMYQPEQN